MYFLKIFFQAVVAQTNKFAKFTIIYFIIEFYVVPITM